VRVCSVRRCRTRALVRRTVDASHRREIQRPARVATRTPILLHGIGDFEVSVVISLIACSG